MRDGYVNHFEEVDLHGRGRACSLPEGRDPRFASEEIPETPIRQPPPFTFMRKRPIRPATIACFGEALWDILPRGIFLGGAPLNVAYHLSRAGVEALPVSAVGRDFLGDEALRRMESWGLGSRFVARPPGRPTGTVRATLDAKGVASYRIARGVAWDRIAVAGALRRKVAPDAIVFGTLALRERFNREALLRLVAAWPRTLRVLDLNLRPPFDRAAALDFALRRAQVVKLNDEELARMTGGPVRTAAQLERAARRFGATHELGAVCVTAGARGAGLFWRGDWFWENGRPVAVRDTVGAGDAFLAGWLSALLARRAAPGIALAAACRLGEFVAGRDGATPPYRVDGHGRPFEPRRQ